MRLLITLIFAMTMIEAAVAEERVSRLNYLSSYEDIAILQKRFLPKTERFEFFAGLSSNINDPFFIAAGLNLRAGYYFSEKWSLEGVLMGMTTAERSVTKDLDEARKIETTGFVTVLGFWGLDLKWSPMYGKIAFHDEKIVPFDFYFSAGFGMSNTNQGHQEPTFHLGAGQIFALSKSVAFRWDFSMMSYQGRFSFEDQGAQGTQEAVGSFNNLFLGAGISYFYPEALYR